MKKLVLVIPLMAISLLPSCSNGGGDNPEPTPDPETIERTISFNIPNCKMYYGDTEIKSSGTKIEIPNVDPYYAKFSVKADDSIYMKPGDVILDKSVGYSFNKDSGDLIINLQSNLNVTGACDMYKSLEECSWSQIAEISELGKAPEAFKVGDTKIVKVNGLDHKVRIIGFNHDKDPEGNDLGITFEFENVITDSNGKVATTKWSSELYNDDYRSSVLNRRLNIGNDCIFNALPEDLKKEGIIKPANKLVGVRTSGNYVSTSFNPNEGLPYPYLFPLAHDEITKTHDDCVTSGEGTTYEYYCDDGNSRIKKSGYWLRSPYTGDNKLAWCVGTDGSLLDYNICGVQIAFAPAFCI